MASNIKVNTTTDAQAEQARANKIWQQNNSMGKDQFLNLLMAQMRNQDPLKPMDDTQFISQMAQFSELQEMQNLNQGFTQLRSVGIIGRYAVGSVVDETTGEKEAVEGMVSSTRMKDGKTYVTINGKDVEANSIEYVSNSEASYQLEQKLDSVRGLIGQKITAGNADKNISGKIKAADIVDGRIVVTVNTIGTQTTKVDWSYVIGLKMLDKKVTAFNSDGTSVSGTATDVSWKTKDNVSGYYVTLKKDDGSTADVLVESVTKVENSMS